MQTEILKSAKDSLLLHNDTAVYVVCNLSDDKIRKVAILKTNKINTPAHRKAH